MAESVTRFLNSAISADAFFVISYVLSSFDFGLCAFLFRFLVNADVNPISRRGAKCPSPGQQCKEQREMNISEALID